MGRLIRLHVDGFDREEIDVSRPGRVKTSLKLDGSGDRIVLLNWAIDETPRLCNIARVDRSGAVVWRVPLPDGPGSDCFVALKRDQDEFCARTYAGLEVRFDVDGRHIAASHLLA